MDLTIGVSSVEVDLAGVDFEEFGGEAKSDRVSKVDIVAHWSHEDISV